MGPGQSSASGCDDKVRRLCCGHIQTALSGHQVGALPHVQGPVGASEGAHHRPAETPPGANRDGPSRLRLGCTVGGQRVDYGRVVASLTRKLRVAKPRPVVLTSAKQPFNMVRGDVVDMA